MTSQEKKLIEFYQTLTNGAEKELKPGMLAKWKPGMRNKKLPEYGSACIVVERIDVVFDKVDESGRPYFREPLDIVMGMTDVDGDMVLFHYDSRRFMPFNAEGDQP